MLKRRGSMHGDAIGRDEARQVRVLEVTPSTDGISAARCVAAAPVDGAGLGSVTQQRAATRAAAVSRADRRSAPRPDRARDVVRDV
jgi:hypothetical protein